MELETFNRDDIGTLLSWFTSEMDFYQWCGSQFSWPLTEGHFRIHLEAMDEEPGMLYPFGLYRMGQLVGYCQLYSLHPEHQWARLSCVATCPRLRQKGLGLKMIQGVLEYGFNQLQLNRISLGVLEQNTPAVALYRKAGFSPEGTLRQHLKIADTFWDCHILSLLRKEWIQSQRCKCEKAIPIPMPKAYSGALMFNTQA